MFSDLDGLRANFRLVDLLDITIISAFMYLALDWMRRRTNAAVLVAIGTSIVLYLLARSWDMFLTSQLFQAGFTVVLVVLVLVFQDDIRRVFERMSAWRFRGAARRLPGEEAIDTLVESVQQMAEARVGALIVIEGHEPVERHVRRGVPLGGEISIPLIRSIFNNKSPGHDGAAIISRSRIREFAVHLPLTTRPSRAGAGGTRHAAALGLAERCDALVIVASEERGTISIAQAGHLHRLKSPGELRTAIDAFYGQFRPISVRRFSWRLVTRQWGLKFLAVALASLLWLAFAYRVGTIERTYELDIELRNPPEGWRLADTEDTRVRVTLSGNERDFRLLDTSELRVSLDAGKLIKAQSTETQQEIFINEDAVVRPDNLAVTQVKPQVLLVVAYQKLTLPVKVATTGRQAEGLDIDFSVQPKEVRVEILRSVSVFTESIPTAAIDLSTIRESTTIKRGLDRPRNVQWADKRAPEVTVTITVVRRKPPKPPPKLDPKATPNDKGPNDKVKTMPPDVPMGTGKGPP